MAGKMKIQIIQSLHALSEGEWDLCMPPYKDIELGESRMLGCL